MVGFGGEPWLCQGPASVHGGGFPPPAQPDPFSLPGVPSRWLRSCRPGPHLLLFEVRKRLLIYRQKMGTWDLGLFASAEDELWCCEALLSPE